MRKHPFLPIALLVSSFFFSGCFEIFYDVIVKPDGTCMIHQTVGLSDVFIEGLSSFGSFGKDSTKQDSNPLTRQSIIDSIRHTFTHRRDSLAGEHGVIGMSGITSITVHDTAVDSMTYFTVETAVASLDSLSGAAHLMNNTTQVLKPGTPADDSDDIRIAVKRAKDKTTLMFRSPQKAEGFMSVDMPGVRELFKGLSMHYRVFSAALEKPTDKRVKLIPGGQERVFGIDELSKKGKKSHLDASFVMRNSTSPITKH